MLVLAPACVLLLSADLKPWLNKPVPEWTDDDAKVVLSDSPWVKTIQPKVQGSSSTDNGDMRRSRGGGMGRGGGIGIGYPGGGMGRRGGYGGGGYPRGGGGASRRPSAPPTLFLRWESALPVRAAELKTRDVDAPTVDESHYAIAVYGVPDQFLSKGSDKGAKDFKKHAVLKRDGKADLKPSSVQVLPRQDGNVVVYLFPKSAEITAKDKRLQFDGRISKLEFSQSFFTDDMTCNGKLEL